MVLDLVRKHGDYVVLFSFDKGTFEVRKNPEIYEKKLAIAEPTTLKALRDDMHEGSMIIEKLVKGGIERHRIWAVIDTVTHLQNRLMTEARQIDVKNPRANDGRRDYVRDATTEVDYNINLTHMSEIANFLSSLPCNIVINSLSREEYVDRKRTGKVVPAISGQSGLRFAGDADAILYLDRDKEGKRWLECNVDTGGDRSGMLSKFEPADLKALAAKMLSQHSQQDSAGSLPESTGEATGDSEAPNNEGAPASTEAPSA
jgi:hypothetical protein